MRSAIKYQDKHQNEVIFVTSYTHFFTLFLQKKRLSESSKFRSNHNVSPYNHPFTFTGKEWCKSQWPAQRGLERGISETGYSYFGARYYDSDLSGLFLSVDPMADKYPSISPYAYCAWNPVSRIDVHGLFDTEKRAQKAHEKAVNHFGKNRVGEIFNRGSKEKPDYAFHVYGAGKDNKTHEAPTGVWAYRPSATISSKWELKKYKYLEAERDNKLSMTLSLGFQGRVNIGSWGVNFNLSSVDLAGLNVDLDKGIISGHYVQENNAKVSSGIGLGIGIFKVGYECNYSGGDYIDRNSVSHSVKGNVLGAGIGFSSGNIEFGIGASLIFGVDLKLTSTIRK